MKNAVKTTAIVGSVLVGAILLAGFAGLFPVSNWGVTLFLSFLALIVACQVVPALMLFGVLVKEVFHPSAKEKGAAKAPAGNGN